MGILLVNIFDCNREELPLVINCFNKKVVSYMLQEAQCLMICL